MQDPKCSLACKLFSAALRYSINPINLMWISKFVIHEKIHFSNNFDYILVQKYLHMYYDDSFKLIIFKQKISM